jgi:hypothetical protein
MKPFFFITCLLCSLGPCISQAQERSVEMPGRFELHRPETELSQKTRDLEPIRKLALSARARAKTLWPRRMGPGTGPKQTHPLGCGDAAQRRPRRLQPYGSGDRT